MSGWWIIILVILECLGAILLDFLKIVLWFNWALLHIQLIWNAKKVAEDYSKSTWLSLYPGTSRSKRTLKSICFIRCEADQHFSCFAVEVRSCLAETGLFSFWSLGCSPWGDLLSTLSLPESPPQKDGDLPPSRTLGEGHALSTALLRLSWS